LEFRIKPVTPSPALAAKGMMSYGLSGND